MEMNELKCKFNILEAKEKLAPCNDNFCTRRENSKQDHPQPNQQYVAPSQAQIPSYVAFTNPVVPPPVHFKRDNQYPQVINTNKGQTQVQPEYYTPYNNIRHPANPYRTTIVPTDGEYRVVIRRVVFRLYLCFSLVCIDDLRVLISTFEMHRWWYNWVREGDI
jgi:hypothetical protein